MNTQMKFLFSMIFLIGLLLAVSGIHSVVQIAAQEVEREIVAKPTSSGAQSVEYIGHIGGGNNAIAVVGNLAYIGEGPTLTILDMTNPAFPTIIGKTIPFAEVIFGIAINGSYAYIATGNAGLRIVNISDPGNPIEVGSYDTPGASYGVVISGNYAYIADWGSGLQIVNVSNPSNPVEVGFYDTSGAATNVVISGNYAYIADWGSGLRIVNVSNPSNLVEVGFYDTSGAAVNLFVSGNYAYIADYGAGLRIVNVSNPSNPVEVGFYDPTGAALDVSVIGNFAFLYSGGIRVIDISDPSNPVETNFYFSIFSNGTMTINQNYAYLAGGYYGGMQVINVSNPSNLFEEGVYNLISPALSVATSGDYMYVIDRNLWVVNISNLNTPTVVNFYDTLNYSLDVKVRDNFAYVVSEGLHILDISDPTNLTESGFYDSPGGTWKVYLSGDYAYLADGNSGLRIIDIADPANPSEIGFYDTPGEARNVVVNGNFAYIANYWSGLRIVDVSDPTFPIEVGFFDTPGEAWSVAVQGNYAYLADNENGVRIIDISDPSNPIEINSLFGTVRDVFIFDYQLYVADSDYGLRIYDISNPANLVETANYPLPGSMESVVTDGELIYMAAGTGGLFILREKNISISHVEITQAIQDTSNNVPLIKGKPTFARVYIDCGVGCSSQPNVSGVLHAYGPGGELLGSPISSVNDSITAYHPDNWTTQRDDLKKTLNFTIPPDWTNGAVTFNAEVNGVELSAPVTFQVTEQKRVISIPIIYQNQEPNTEIIGNGFSWALQNYPLANLHYTSGSSITWQGQCLGNDCESNDLKYLMAKKLLHGLTLQYWIYYIFSSPSEKPDFIFGWVPAFTETGGDSDPTWNGGSGKAAFGMDNPIEAQKYFAHEIAHLLNRRHTNTNANLSDSNCKTNNGSTAFIDPQSDWVKEDGNPGAPPFPDSKIQDFGLDGFGFGWLISSNNATKDPGNTYDYMSYCGNLQNDNIWTSPWTFEHIYTQLQPLGENSESNDAGQSYFIASGLVFTDDTAILDPIWAMTSTITPENPPVGTQYCLEAQDASNTVLSSQCFDLSFVDYETGASVNVDGFSWMLPYPAGAARFVLKKSSQELAQQVVSANMPTVTVLSPNGGESWGATGTQTISWSANDTDGDELTYMVQYSPDGVNWIPVGGIVTGTQVTVNAAELAGGMQAGVKVLATDGVNTSFDVSDAPFSVGKKEPQAFILNPETKITIPVGVPLLLQGYAYDLEDGTLDGAVLSWSSDLDGSLGTGSYILADLSQGDHQITLSVMDGDGNVGIATITVHVGFKIYLPIARN